MGATKGRHGGDDGGGCVPRGRSRPRPPLALPPSTNCPDSFQELYQLYQSVVATCQSPQLLAAGCDGDGGDAPFLISDVVPHILSYCDARTLSRASCVSRSWSMYASANDLWTELCKMVFGVAPFELRPPPDPTRVLYVMSHRKLRETLMLSSERSIVPLRRGLGGGGVPLVSAAAVGGLGA